jgi:hypothetical protein
MRRTDIDVDEVEEAFRNLWRVGPVGEDWKGQAALYTPDAFYIDHFYGQMTMADFVPWCDRLMNEEFPELYTAYEWHVVDGTRVVAHMQNRRDNPRPGGPPIDFPGISIFEYAGDGLWCYERDYWSVSEAATAARTYRAAVEQFDPNHPSRRSRRNWPKSPDWTHP